jgi:hypothetical protein
MTAEGPELRLEINKHQLDTELADQPAMVYEWACHAAQAMLETDRAKDALTVCEADLAGAIRSNPTKYGLAKVTEDAVKAAVAGHPLRQQAAEVYYQARYNSSVCQGAVQALEHRKRALSGLVDLYLSNYFNTLPAKARGIHQDD